MANRTKYANSENRQLVMLSNALLKVEHERDYWFGCFDSENQAHNVTMRNLACQKKEASVAFARGIYVAVVTCLVVVGFMCMVMS